MELQSNFLLMWRQRHCCIWI